MLPSDGFDWRASRCPVGKKATFGVFLFYFFGCISSLAPSIFPYEVHTLLSRKPNWKSVESHRRFTASLTRFTKNSNAWVIKTTELIKTQQHTLKIICHWHNDSLCLLAAVRTFVVQVARWKLLTDRLIILFINYYIFLAAKKKRTQ